MIQFSSALDVDNKVVLDISQVEKYSKRNLICPECKRKVFARKGQKRKEHFYHYEETDCSGSTESPVHIMFKLAVLEVNRIYLGNNKFFEYDWSKVEVKDQDFVPNLDYRPDAIAKNDQGEVWYLEGEYKHPLEEATIMKYVRDNFNVCAYDLTPIEDITIGGMIMIIENKNNYARIVNETKEVPLLNDVVFDLPNNNKSDIFTQSFEFIFRNWKRILTIIIIGFLLKTLIRRN